MITFNEYISIDNDDEWKKAIRNARISSGLKTGAILGTGALEGKLASRAGKTRKQAAIKAAKQGAIQGMGLDVRRAIDTGRVAKHLGWGRGKTLGAVGLSLVGSAVRGAAGGAIGSQLGYREKDKRLKQRIKNRMGL